jgi:ABC-type Zn uptake system ZnuABC Zn-binding protein ZnuA
MRLSQVFFSCSAALLFASTAGAEISVSSFSTILTEVVERVGGEKVKVTAHVKPGVDPHEFDPKPSDLQVVSRSQLVLLSAKHMEGYVGKLKEATGGKVRIVEVGNEFPSLKLEGGHHHHHHGHGRKEAKGEGEAHDHAHAVEDPHWWHSVGNVQRAVRIVRDELAKISPGDKAVFSRNADAYLEELKALEKWVRAKVAELPRNQRKLVTSHDAFQYFAREHGFTIYAVEGLSTAEQPSSKKVAEMISAIKKEGVKAIFPESIQNPKVLTEITRETGAKAGPALYADGLGEGEASTYAGMMKYNVTSIVDSLK